MPEMSDDNYKLLLERLAAQDKKLADYEKRLDDVTAMNRELLSGTEEPKQSKPERMKELKSKLFGGK